MWIEDLAISFRAFLAYVPAPFQSLRMFINIAAINTFETASTCFGYETGS